MCSTSDDHTLLPCSYAALSRREIRALIFHVLYAVEAFEYEQSVEAVVDNFNRGFDWDIPKDAQAVVIAQAVIDERDALDEMVKPFLQNWRFERIGVCTKLILRLAFWELKQKDISPSIIINEAIELAKCFAEKDAYRFINGILDEASKSVPEFQQSQGEEPPASQE